MRLRILSISYTIDSPLPYSRWLIRMLKNKWVRLEKLRKHMQLEVVKSENTQGLYFYHMPTISEKGWLSDSEAQEKLIGRCGIWVGALSQVTLRKYVSNFLPLMYVLWKSFFRKEIFKKDAFKDLWEPWMFFFSLLTYSNEIDSSHSNLELIIEEWGKILRF